MPEHVVAPLAKRHGVPNWEYADAAARTAATGFIPSDVTKFARQLDDNSVWMLIDDSPVTWVAVGGAGSIADDSVTNAKLANMAQATIKGRASGAGTGDPTDLTSTQATAILDNVIGDSGLGGTKGLVPAPAAGDAAAGKFLKATGGWDLPGGAGGAGSITVVHLSADVTNSTATAVKITGLDTALNLGTYKFEYWIRYQAALTSTGVKFSVNFTGTQTAFMVIARYTTPGTTSVSDFGTQDVGASIYQAWAKRAPSTAANMGPTNNTDTANADVLHVLEGLMIVTASGNIELYHASDVAADSTVMTGTSLIITQID